MTEIFRLITPITYWILIALWSFILYFYVKKMWDSKTKQLFHALVIILAIDAFRTLFESLYFGLWYTSLSGIIPSVIGKILTRPELVIIPKILNVIAAIAIIVLLLKRWLPKEEEEQQRLGVALHESEQEFRAFFENNPVSCWLEDFSEVKNYFNDLHKQNISNLEQHFDEYPEELAKLAQVIKIKDVNQATLDLHRAQNKEELLEGLGKTFTPESFNVFRKEIIDLWQGKTQGGYDGQVKTLGGELRYVQMNYRVLPGYEESLEKVLISLIDNTPKWLAEQKMFASEKRLNLAMEFTNDGLYDWNVETNETWFSSGWRTMLGYGPDELENEFSQWERLTHPDDIPVALKMINEVLERKRPRFEMEYRMKHKNGHWVEILSRANAEFNDEGQAERVVGTHVDITERKRFEKELLLQKEQLEQYLNLAGVIFIALNTKGIVTLINQKGCDILGYPKKEILGKNWFDNFLPETSKKEILPISKSLLNDQLENFEYVENPILTRKGEERLIAWHNTVIKNTSGEVIGHLSAGEDITEKKQLQHQLLQAQKMESIGNLAGGIAHDFNNILSSIIGFTELALEDAPQGSSQKEELEEVYVASQRAKELVQQILTFARQSDEETRPVKFDTIITEALKLLRPSTPSTIEIIPSIKNTAPVTGNPTQLHQVIMNLCTNAIHSMQNQGGTLEISLKNEHVKDDTAKGLPKISDGYVELTVTDNGPGIDPKNIDKIFEPYFTTKEIGEGTGMGLAMVKGIVESYGGTIEVESHPGKKTSFRIRLPATKKTTYKTAGPLKPSITGTERILFVDDEAPLARMGSRLLEGLGYKVTSQTDSVEALALFKEKPDAFDLVITDMTMPKMTGDMLARELREIKPGVPIILCSGYSSKINTQHLNHLEISAFAVKPFTKSELSQTIRKVLDAS